MDNEIVKAITGVMSAVPKLAKGEKNSHGNYNFASIDDFLEAVRPLMAKSGLVIASNEEDLDVIGQGKDAWLKMRFGFTLHANGADFGPLYRTTMVRASMGSQAFGAAQSYAEKQFLRSLFKIATGEGGAIDADSHMQSDLPSLPDQPAARQKLDGPHTSKTALRKAVNEIISAVRKCDDKASLDDLMRESKATIAQAKRDWPSLIDGDPNIEEDIGLQGAVQLRRQQLSDPVNVLVAEMKAETTSQANLAEWYSANSDRIEALDDEAGRRFGDAWEAWDAELPPTHREKA